LEILLEILLSLLVRWFIGYFVMTCGYTWWISHLARASKDRLFAALNRWIGFGNQLPYQALV
jgi:hypothetical protein